MQFDQVQAKPRDRVNPPLLTPFDKGGQWGDFVWVTAKLNSLGDELERRMCTRADRDLASRAPHCALVVFRLIWTQDCVCRGLIGLPGAIDAWPMIQWPSRTRAIPSRTREGGRGGRARRRARHSSARRSASCTRCPAISNIMFSSMCMTTILPGHDFRHHKSL